MKRIIGLTAGALMGASVIAAPAFAEQVDYLTDTPRDGAASEMNTMGEAASPRDTSNPDAGIDAGTTAAIGPSFDNALSAIEAGATNTAALGAVGEVETVNVVHIETLDGHDAAAVEQAVSQNDAEVEELRSTIAGNPALNEQLQAQGVDTSSVVAAEVDAGGEVTVYVM